MTNSVPTQLKMIRGTYREDRAPENEPQPKRVAPAPPRGLSKQARKVWTAYAEKLETLGVLTEIDGLAFTLLSIHYDIAWQASQVVNDEGITDVDNNGGTRKHPALQILRDNSQMFLRFATEFGLTPASRSRINAS